MASSSNASPFPSCPLLNESPALQMSGGGDQVCLAEAAIDFGGVSRNIVGSFAIRNVEMLLNNWQEEVAFFSAVIAFRTR
jgi:hypothetical protein